MSATVMATRMRVADPKPAYCSTCFQAAQEGVEFVDTTAAYEGPTVTDAERGALINVMDDIYVCFSCVAEMARMANYKPEFHREQQAEISRLETLATHWQERAEKLEKIIAAGRPEPVRKAKR